MMVIATSGLWRMLGSRCASAYIVIRTLPTSRSYQHAVVAGVPSRRTVASTAIRGSARNRSRSDGRFIGIAPDAKPSQLGSDLLGDHLDRSAGTFDDAHAAALAVVEVEGVRSAVPPGFEHRVVGAHPEAVVAREAIAAREAAARLEQGR